MRILKYGYVSDMGNCDLVVAYTKILPNIHLVYHVVGILAQNLNFSETLGPIAPGKSLHFF